jgi:hypothetical protein
MQYKKRRKRRRKKERRQRTSPHLSRRHPLGRLAGAEWLGLRLRASGHRLTSTTTTTASSRRLLTTRRQATRRRRGAAIQRNLNALLGTWRSGRLRTAGRGGLVVVATIRWRRDRLARIVAGRR